jgi:hypothetical protein
MSLKTSNKIQFSFPVGLILVVSGSLAGWSVLLKVLHAIYPEPAPMALLAIHLLWTAVSPAGCILLFAGIYYGIGAAYLKWAHIADTAQFSLKLALPFIFFAFWIVKPFVNYQRGIFTSTAILAAVTLILLTRKEIWSQKRGTAAT